MATTVWKGFLTFGLVSIPVKLSRAARPEKVSFRQLHAATGARVRQALIVPEEPEAEPEPEPQPVRHRPSTPSAVVAPFVIPRQDPALPAPQVPEPPREVSRAEIVKGFEIAKDRYVTISKEELAELTPKTAREMQILEFVRLAEVDPIYFETSYYAAPDKGGERPYALLFEALRQSGFVGLAQVAMHNREHIVIVRPGRHGLILHTMFYDSEIRQEDEYRANPGEVGEREMELALMLVKSLAAPFEPSKYRDTFREQVDALIAKKMAGGEETHAAAPRQSAAPVVDILAALQKSLEGAQKKPAATETGQPHSSRRKRAK